MQIRIAVTVSLSLLLLFAATAPSAEFEAVQKERVELMKDNSSANKTLRAAAKEGNMDQVEESARALASQFARIPELFPEGSGGGDTRAKPEIWQNWSDFEEHAENARKLALAVAAQAQAGNVKETQTLANSLAKQACSGCHEIYRAPKKKD